MCWAGMEPRNTPSPCSDQDSGRAKGVKPCWHPPTNPSCQPCAALDLCMWGWLLTKPQSWDLNTQELPQRRFVTSTECVARQGGWDRNRRFSQGFISIDSCSYFGSLAQWRVRLQGPVGSRKKGDVVFFKKIDWKKTRFCFSGCYFFP